MDLLKPFKDLFKHSWVTDAEMSKNFNYTYQTCAKTGDRRVITSRIEQGFQAVEETWLAAATSGTYYIDGIKISTGPKKKDVVVPPTPTV